jgi:hypothetical protein
MVDTLTWGEVSNGTEWARITSTWDGLQTITCQIRKSKLNMEDCLPGQSRASAVPKYWSIKIADFKQIRTMFHIVCEASVQLALFLRQPALYTYL